MKFGQWYDARGGGKGQGRSGSGGEERNGMGARGECDVISIVVSLVPRPLPSSISLPRSELVLSGPFHLPLVFLFPDFDSL